MPFFSRRAHTAGRCGGPSQSTVIVLIGERFFQFSFTNIDISLVKRLPVAGGGWLFGQWEVGLDLIDLLGLVGVLVDHGLLSTIVSIGRLNCHNLQTN